MPKSKIKVVELFAGVGGFRLGLEGWQGKSATSGYTEGLNSRYQVIWSNQWEPKTKIQHASMIYEHHWGRSFHNSEDISIIDPSNMPDHDLLVGGFPCQDYSVATTLKNSKGIAGNKGMLWWSIYRILKKKVPKYIFLENVDRLLISPSATRGSDFATILKSLEELDYAVEWRVVNAAEYGMPQRRKRLFILAYHKSSQIYNVIQSLPPTEYITECGTMAGAFPVTSSVDTVDKSFVLAIEKEVPPQLFSFENAGLMIGGQVTTIKTQPQYQGHVSVLKDVLFHGDVPDSFYINENDLGRWQYLKGAKREIRKNALGHEYYYNEGGIAFPDPADKPSRTIITSEGGNAPSRCKHVILTTKGMRRLVPLELERLNMFPDHHSRLEGISDSKRAFLMGNALVVGVVEKIGASLQQKIVACQGLPNSDSIKGLNLPLA